MSGLMSSLMKQILIHGFLLEVEEQEVSTLPMSCAPDNGMDSIGVNMHMLFL